MRKSLREHWPLILICLFYMIGSDILTAYIAQDHPEFDFYPLTTIVIYILQFYFSASICIATFLVGYFVWYVIKNFHARPFWRQLVLTFKNRFLTAERLHGFILIFLLMPLFFAFIAMYKQLIPFVRPFAWDKTLMHWDYVVHFNHHPWQLLQPLVGYPIITKFLAKIYGFWFTVLAGVILWQANSSERFYRMQFFLSFLLVWIILGTLMAYCLSSAGPCYYGVFSHDASNPYAPLLAYLHQAAPSWLINLQSSLLSSLTSNTLIIGGGVSAMPSMHVSMATLCFLICNKRNKWLGAATFIFLILIMIGSIHLAWHYAMDGYISFVGTLLIWYVVGKVLRYSEARSRLQARELDQEGVPAENP